MAPVTSANLLWILALPNLEQADVDCPRWKSEDIFYLTNNSDAWKKSPGLYSRVKDLILTISVDERGRKSKLSSITTTEEGQRALEDLLLYTSGLKRSGLVLGMSAGGGDVIESTVFRGLKRSFKSLETLEVRGMYVSYSPSAIKVLPNFSNLQNLVLDAFLGRGVEGLLRILKFKLKNDELFGTSPLATIRLLGNFRRDLPFTLSFNPEHFIAFLMQSPNRPSSLKRVITYRKATC